MTSITRELRKVRQFSLNVRPEHVHVRLLHVHACLRHELDGLLGNVLAHAVVDAAAREDHLRVIARSCPPCG
jgi:hypothetical protein